jgi:hypothetical protein
MSDTINDITIGQPVEVIVPPQGQDSDDGVQAVQAEAGEMQVHRVPEPSKVYEREIRTKGCRLLPECFVNIASGTWIIVGQSQYSEGYSYPMLATFDETMKARAEAFAIAAEQKKERYIEKITQASYATNRIVSFEMQGMAKAKKVAEAGSIAMQREEALNNVVGSCLGQIQHMMHRTEEVKQTSAQVMQLIGFNHHEVFAGKKRTRRGQH